MKAALARIQAKTLLLTSQTDRTIPAYLSRELYAGSVLEMREAEAAARSSALM